MKAYWVAVLLALAVVPVQATDKAKPAKPDKPKLVCFAEPSTGSHIRKRTCMTEVQYADRRKRDQDAMQRMKGKVKPNDASAR